MKHRLPLVFVSLFLTAIAWVCNPQQISKAVAQQGGTATEVRNETIKIDLSKTPTQFEQQVDLLPTANGIELLASKDRGYLISSEIKVPIDSPEPFLAVTAKWAAKIYDGGVSVSIRARSESGSWDDWIDLQDDDDSRLSANEYGGGLILLDKRTTYVQYRISIEKGEHSAPNSIVSEIGLTFISPGATSKVMWDEIQSTVEGTQPQGDAPAAFSKPAVISRTAWGCPDGVNSPSWTPQYTTVTHLIIHHTDTANTSSDWPAVVRSIWSYHTNSNGWGDIGYNYLVDPNGNIYEGRAGGDNVIGAHFSCANTNTMGVAALGTFSTVSPTSSALTSTEKLLAWKSDQRGIDPLGTTFHSATQLNLKNISGHKDGNATTAPGTCEKGTACPGTNLYGQLPSIRNDVKNLISGGGQSPDLTITAGSQSVTPTSVAAGSSITAGCSEGNSGTAAAGANVVSLYLSTDAVLTPGSNGDTYLGFIQFSSVAANSNSPVNSKSIQIPSGTAPGTYYLYFWADGEQVVSESTEGNNFASRQLTVTGGTGGGAGTVQFSSAAYSVNENGGSKTITVTRTGGTGAFVVNYGTSNGTATAGADYTGLNEVLSFATNDTSKTFAVPIINDTLVESNETLNLTLSNPSGGVTLGSPGTAVLTIVDNDSACTYSISSSENTVSPEVTSVNFFMDAPSGCAWTAVSDSESWLTTSSSGSGDGTISYRTASNTSSNPRVGHITVGGQVHTVTQIGVGGAGNVQFSSVTYSSNEGGAGVTITVTRAGGTGTGSVQYSTSDGTATAGVDYVSASGLLLFGGNETSKSFNVTILDDTTFEGGESFGLSLKGNSSSFTLGSPSTATVTIADNDTLQAPTANAGGPYAAQTDQSIQFNGSASSDPDGTISSYSWDFGDGSTGAGATPTHAYAAAGTYTVTLTVTDDDAATGSAATTANITRAGGTAGLQYYPLARPVRMLDTRPGQIACYTPGAPLAADASRTQTAVGTCQGLVIPASAKAIVGNATVVSPPASGHITLYPAGAPLPTASNLNYVAGQIVPNAFTVGLSPDGSFNIYTPTSTHFIIDVAGYYAPPGQGGLYYHPLPHPFRLLDTRIGQAACDAPGAPLQAGGVRTESARTTCNGVVLPADAKAIVGNATVVNNSAGASDGHIILYPSGAAQPVVSNLNYVAGQIVPNAFTVGLGADGAFNIFAYTSTHFIVDMAGYYSASAAADSNGAAGLLFYPLPSPTRLLDTRPGQVACDAPGAPLAANSVRTEQARLTCAGSTVPTSALAVLGNATVVTPAASGHIILYPSGAAQPVVSQLNYLQGQIIPNAFNVGLGADGAFNIYTPAQTHFVIDMAGYFAP